MLTGKYSQYWRNVFTLSWNSSQRLAVSETKDAAEAYSILYECPLEEAATRIVEHIVFSMDAMLHEKKGKEASDKYIEKLQEMLNDLKKQSK